MKTQPSKADAIRVAAQVVRDGVAFFQRVKSLSADPRTKFIFGRAAEEYGRSLEAIQEVPGTKGKTPAPTVFPFEDYDRMTCSVCGKVVRGKEPPETCPGCGAARYAFERDVKPDEAWGLVARTTKESLAILRKVPSDGSNAAVKEAMAKAIAIHKRLLEETKEERARIVASP